MTYPETRKNTLPIFNCVHLMSANTEFFRKPSLYRPGVIRLLLNRISPRITTNETRFVCRLSYRDSRKIVRRQHCTRHLQQRYARTEYYITHQTYALCAISWHDHSIAVLQEYHSKKEALEALRS